MKKTFIGFLLGILMITSAFASDRRVRVINHTNHAITYLYASNVGESRWTYDMLQDQVIPPHSSILADMDDGTGYCKFDLKAIDDRGFTVERYRVNVCVMETWDLF